jgi:hypothetical protein
MTDECHKRERVRFEGGGCDQSWMMIDGWPALCGARATNADIVLELCLCALSSAITVKVIRSRHGLHEVVLRKHHQIS